MVKYSPDQTVGRQGVQDALVAILVQVGSKHDVVRYVFLGLNVEVLLQLSFMGVQSIARDRPVSKDKASIRLIRQEKTRLLKNCFEVSKAVHNFDA